MFIDKNGYIRKPVAYLADFQMFLPGIEKEVERWKKICDKYGIIGLFPGDPQGEDYVPYERKDDSILEFSRYIFFDDYNQMKRSDICIAQLDNWRGKEPDSGTAFELGWFAGKGLPIYGYMSKESSLEYNSHGLLKDENGYGYEDRDFPIHNIYQTVTIRETLEEVCKQIRKDFDEQLIAAGYEPYKVKED